MKAPQDEPVSSTSRAAVQVAKVYRRLKVDLDALEAIRDGDSSSTQDFPARLDHSRKLCEHLRKLAHALISAEETGRLQLGKSLQDDILQMMVGIHIRLLNLDRDVSSEGDAIKLEIATIQQMVQESSDLLSGMTGRKKRNA